MSKKKSANVDTALFSVLLATFEPLVSALDHNKNEFGEIITNEAADTGQERPSQRDMGMRIVIGQILQTLHNQCYGVLNTRSGTKMPNAKEQMDTSEQRVAELTDRLQEGNLSERDFQTIHWFQVNEARFHMLNDLIGAFQQLHQNITGENWKPYERKDEKKIDITEDQKKELLAKLAKAGLKNKQPPVNTAA